VRWRKTQKQQIENNRKANRQQRFSFIEWHWDKISRRGMSWDADGMSTVTELTWSPPAAGSKYGDQRHWRPGYRQLTVWQVAPEDDWYWQSAVSAGHVGRRRVPAVPGIAAQFHVLLCKSSRRPCNRSAAAKLYLMSEVWYCATCAVAVRVILASLPQWSVRSLCNYFVRFRLANVSSFLCHYLLFIDWLLGWQIQSG